MPAVNRAKFYIRNDLFRALLSVPEIVGPGPELIDEPLNYFADRLYTLWFDEGFELKGRKASEGLDWYFEDNVLSKKEYEIIKPFHIAMCDLLKDFPKYWKDLECDIRWGALRNAAINSVNELKKIPVYPWDEKAGEVPCPVCGYPTLESLGGYDVCDLCCWEDDGGEDFSVVNRTTVEEAQSNFKKFLKYDVDDNSETEKSAKVKLMALYSRLRVSLNETEGRELRLQIKEQRDILFSELERRNRKLEAEIAAAKSS